MKVLHAPFFEGNQFQELLEESLERAGVDVLRETGCRPFSLFAHQLILDDIDVLHLHWTHPYFLFGSEEWAYRLPLSRQICALAALWFLFQVWISTLVCDRTVWTVHNKCNHERRYKALDLRVSQKLVSLVDKVQVWDPLTHSEFLTYVGTEPNEVSEIPHGNYLPRYEGTNTPTKEAAKEALGLHHTERVYLYFGVIRPYKQVTALIQSFQAIESKATLVIAGNPMNSDLTARIEEFSRGSENIQTTLEYIPDDTVPVFFAAADAVVLPYEHIFNSGSVLLAMTFGRTFVAPRMGSIPSVDPGGNVLYDDLIRGLEQIDQMDEEQLSRVGDANLVAAREKHDWDTIAAEYIELYS
ncbi:glycosyltransferase family 4 protein [Haloferax namakaokahaiae]|uniref:Glycosyltransferase family 4 protein n=1 Tax=Haloferax namakaokahaiae TaxID=1748331 RepID=A0ABD5ZFC3_9EURY